MNARTSRGLALGGVAALVLGLTACSSDPPDPEPVAETLADALTSGDFGAVPLAGTSAADATGAVEEIVEGMGGTSRSASVQDVVAVEDVENTWTVTFDVAWNLSANDDEPSDDADDGASDDETGEPDEATGEPTEPGEDGGNTAVEWAYTTSAELSVTGEGDEEQWQVEWSPALLHPDLTAGDRLRVRRETAERAEILGAGESVLVTGRDVYRIGIDKTRFEDGTSEDDMIAAAQDLAELVDVDAESLGERVQAAGDKAFVDAITLRAPDAEDMLDDIEDIDGAVALQDTMHLAPSREFARPVLGTVGEATAEIVEESGGTIQAGDEVGLSGLQRQYDEQLRGTPGMSVQIVPAEGDPEAVFETEAVPGENLTTTLSTDLQMHAESVLADVEPASAIVAIQPSTGDVLAAASGPGGEGYSTATLGQYAPGSTFKVVTALALLRSGLSPDSTVECPPTLDVDGREFGNYSDYPDSALGEISLTTAIAESCNTAMMGQRDQASQADLADAAASLGLGTDAALGYPSFLGSVPAEADGTAHAASMIGQGEILASPLAMATVAASVAAGETVVPRLVVQGDASDSESSLEEGEAEQLREMMYAAVDGGSASLLQSVPGDQVGAKTGTAEYGTDQPPRTHAWMIAFQGDLAVAAFVEDGEGGGRTAGPLLEEFLTNS